MSCDHLTEFNKEFKQFSKSYRSLPEDLEKFEKLITDPEAIAEVQFFEGSKATRLIDTAEVVVVKARLDCKSLGNKQMLRIIYAHYPSSGQLLMIELFSKNEKPREDVARYRKYLLPSA